MSLPRVDHLGLGGTIASKRVDADPGVVPVLSAEEISLAIPGIEQIADVRAAQFLWKSSSQLDLSDLISLRDEVGRRIEDGARGVVITQGTDSIEETSYVMDLLWGGSAPVVFTGAMRNPSLPGADGPANVLAAIQVAISEQARDLGGLVVLNDEIHAARFVRKTHTSALDTFRSPAAGPLGWVSEGVPYVAMRPVGRYAVELRAEDVRSYPTPPVALLHIGLGDDGRLIDAVASLGYAGVVLEAFGGGHVPPSCVEPVRRLAQQLPVVLTSRTGVGPVLRETYRFPGSEIELLEMGVIRGGSLDARKARLLLILGLASGRDVAGLRTLFAEAGLSA